MYDVERGQNAGIRPMLWQNDTSVAVASWGWIGGQVPGKLAFSTGADGLKVQLPPSAAGAALPGLRITPATRTADARRRQVRN